MKKDKVKLIIKSKKNRKNHKMRMKWNLKV